MFTKIDIQRFGLFKDFEWDALNGGNETFRRLNVIYGRNYSGKTTLSRIFRSIEKGTLHVDYSDAKFSIALKDGGTITESNIQNEQKNWTVRVYNSDFVNDNLSWLHNNDGTIEPFTILGSKNVDIDKKIKEIEEKIGSIEDKKGLLFELTEMGNLSNQKRINFEQKENALEDKLKKKAKSIKDSAATFSMPTYNIGSIRNDIPKAKGRFVLSEDEVTDRKRLLKDEPKGHINGVTKVDDEFQKNLTQTKELLSRKISVSSPISELVGDSLLQAWVRSGIDLHKTKRQNCGFCGNTLSPELWAKLSEHFNQESEDLRAALDKLLNDTIASTKKFANVILPDKNLFYSGNKEEIEILSKAVTESIKNISKSYESIIKQIKTRLSDIFLVAEMSEPKNYTDEINISLDNLNSLIEKNNSQTNRLSSDQKIAREELRLSEIVVFLGDINYEEEIADIGTAKNDFDTYEKDRKNRDRDLISFKEEKISLEAQAKDESKGAQLVNQHLTHFFGHRQLRLVASGDTTNIKFKIERDGNDAKNLSEGECSLISFCYFIAKMEDQMKDDSNLDKLIIYIDDPISSLDTNHIFFMFSLIETVIAKNKKYGQLFISTHNLDFLKYLKKLTSPPKVQIIPNTKMVSGTQNFLVERYKETNTQLKLSPEYLKNYVTEFNYLFNQIYLCANADAATMEHSILYNFGNNMRKFLESYLFYKYPNNELTFAERLTKFFGGDEVSYNLINRVVNEYSHLEELRGLEPVDSETTVKIAKAVLSRIETVDNDQYAALVASLSN